VKRIWGSLERPVFVLKHIYYGAKSIEDVEFRRAFTAAGFWMSFYGRGVIFRIIVFQQ
jgi:hypothetical protein